MQIKKLALHSKKTFAISKPINTGFIQWVSVSERLKRFAALKNLFTWCRFRSIWYVAQHEFFSQSPS